MGCILRNQELRSFFFLLQKKMQKNGFKILESGHESIENVQVNQKLISGLLFTGTPIQTVISLPKP